MEFDLNNEETKQENCGPAEADSESGLVVDKIIDNPRSCIVRDQVDSNMVKILLICPNQEQRLITFHRPSGDCTVQDLLDEAKIPMCKALNIFLVKDPTTKINYVIKYLWKTNSLSEEGGNQGDANLDESATKEDNSLGFFSSPEENKGNSSFTENKTLEKENKEENQLLKSKQEGLGGGVQHEIQNMEFDGSIQSPHTSLICRIVIIGSYNYTSQERVIISQSGVRWRAPLIEDDTNFVVLELKLEDILKVVIQFEKVIPVVFFYVKLSAVHTIRELLGMEESHGPYYDPLSLDDRQKRLALLVDEITEESKLVLKTLFFPNKVLLEITTIEAADLLWLTASKNIRPQIDSWIRGSKQASTSAVDNTVNDDVETLVEEPHNRSMMQISEQTTSKLKDTVNKKIEPVFKHLTSSIEISGESASTVENPVHPEVQTLLVYPPPPSTGSITITAQDYACLEESHLLNDIIIDFYLKYFTLQVLSEEDRDRTHIFSIHFYTRLTSQHSLLTNSEAQLSPATKRHFNVHKWTKNVNIFEKDFIIVPINRETHWFLAIICFPGLVGKAQVNATTAEACEIGKTTYKRRKAKEMKLKLFTKQVDEEIKRFPCILIFDSLAGPTSRAQSVIGTLREYLTSEHLVKLGTERIFTEENMKAASPKVPQQTNSSDCGLYLLQYVESFFSDPIADYTLPIETLKHWFDEILVIRKRRELSKLIRKLMER